MGKLTMNTPGRKNTPAQQQVPLTLFKTNSGSSSCCIVEEEDENDERNEDCYDTCKKEPTVQVTTEVVRKSSFLSRRGERRRSSVQFDDRTAFIESRYKDETEKDADEENLKHIINKDKIGLRLYTDQKSIDNDGLIAKIRRDSLEL